MQSSAKFFTKSFSIANLIGDVAGKSSSPENENDIDPGGIYSILKLHLFIFNLILILTESELSFSFADNVGDLGDFDDDDDLDDDDSDNELGKGAFNLLT